MYSSLDDVEFLSRSESRVEVIETIDEAPRTRDELKQATEASRTTLSRMLADFEDRDWIFRENGRYQSTPEGAFVASEVTRLLENMETAEKLDGSLRWLPIDEFEFDLRRLRDAEVVTLRWNDPATMRLLAERLDGASRVRSIATSVSREIVDMIQEMSVERDATYEGILADSAVEIVREHPELRRQLREILGSDRTTVYRYDGDEELAMVMLIDDQAAVCNHGNGGPQMEAVITDDEAFRSWVETYFESARTDAQPLDVEAFVT
jgi:predicted transcriptional regulator